RHRDEVLLDDAGLIAPGELSTNSRCCASGKPTGRSAAAPDVHRFSLDCRLPPRLPQVRHPGDVFKPAWIRLDLGAEFLELSRRNWLGLCSYSGDGQNTRRQENEGLPGVALHVVLRVHLLIHIVFTEKAILWRGGVVLGLPACPCGIQPYSTYAAYAALPP